MSATILLVEDEPNNRELAETILVKSGFRTVCAENGADAIRLACDSCPDLILMDLSLPVIDGWEAIRKIRAQDALKEVPIVALTAHAMRGDREKAIASGADDYLAKPYRFGELLAVVHKHLGLR